MKATRLILSSLMFCFCAVALEAQLKDMQIGSRPLTDADMEKYVAIHKVAAKAAYALKGDTSPGAVQKLQETTRKACEPHGWGTLDYSVVNARVDAALMLIKMEKQTPVPPKKKADVTLVKKWQDKITEARKP